MPDSGCYQPSKFASAKSNRFFSCSPSMPRLLAVFMMPLLCWLPERAAGEDTLQTVMARMKPDSAVAINYRETRYLSLMTEKWTGFGYFYALLPDVMIKEQQRPEQELMAIKGAELYYFNQHSGQKNQGELTEDNPDSHAAVFKGLMNGDQAYLKSLYDIEFVSKPVGWTITLTDPNKAEAGYKVIMQGLPGQAANKLELFMPDGDRTEYWLSPATSGEAIKTKIQHLLDLLGAD